ncbi:MAG TPA: M48 family metalloprotease [Rhizomicrobium sp.]|nr:M48 family metalloprotease [Rhizomicrobium sp.]
MRRALLAGLALASLPALAFASQGDGYPRSGTAIEALKPASDYSDALKGRPLALGIMRTRGQGFVPSPELNVYVTGVMMRLLKSVQLPASFHPEVHILAAPEFAGECTPDGTLIITVGLLEQLETEDELAFVLGHELAHAIYRHEAPDWYKKSQYYAVVNGVAVDTVAQGAVSFGGNLGGNIGRGIDVAQHLAKLSANVLMPQMERGQEDAADALGFDLMVKAGYDPEAPLAVMDKLAEQEAEAAQAAQQARAAAKADKGSDSGGGFFDKLSNVTGGLGTILAGGRPSTDQIADLAIFAFDTAVDNMADDATTHHPAKEREDLLSDYEFREYRTIRPVQPTPLPWAPDSRSPLKPQLTAMFSHYTDAENAAAYIADASQGTAPGAQGEIARATATPTIDHAYTEFVAAEYYEGHGEAPQSEAALVKAVNGPEPSWEIYSRLTDIYIARNDYAKAQALMDQAVTRFDNSPVLYPKRIQIYRARGDLAEANALMPQCKAADIDELYDACKKANGS